MPPGKILLVVISRSLCECHMKAKPASPLGEFAIVPDGGVLPVAPQEPAGAPALQPVARIVAFGPGQALPPSHAPLVNRFGSGRVTGPPLATSPNGFACTGLLWSWHHS